MSSPAGSQAGPSLAVAAFLAALLGLAGFVPLFGVASSDSEAEAVGVTLSTMISDASGACLLAPGPIAGLTSQQANNGGEIVSAVFAAGGEDEQAGRIALMVAWTESGLRDLGPMPGNQGSLGLFQQRGWGTAQQEMAPSVATALFMARLLALPGWRSLPPWVAAQDVQHSRFTDGSNYRANWALAGRLLDAMLAAGNQPGACGQGIPAGTAGPASAHGLPPGYAIPSGTGPAHTAVAAWALRQLGKPYVWGAFGPIAFDCSGLTMAAWQSIGISLVHYTVDQQTEGTPVGTGQLMAGDLVLIPGSDPPGPGQAGHVGLYLGSGLVESAVDPQVGVVVQTWNTFTSGGLVALRDPDPSDG
jgi:peptidoglycan DL-endopeptidase CwlO